MNRPQPEPRIHHAELERILQHNPTVTAAIYDPDNARTPYTILVPPDFDALTPLTLSPDLAHEARVIPYPRLTSLELRAHHPNLTHPWTECQNEPIQLGCQMQPHTGLWVGTAGAPARTNIPGDRPRWGILTNWHVADGAQNPPGAAQHQPDTRYPAFAHLTHTCKPDPTKPNTVDAAFCDTLIDGHHTHDLTLLGIGTPSPHHLDATPGIAVQKTGRTTGRTRARCLETGASVRVQYANFTAIFHDQDLYIDDPDPFSAPGDSGSLILTLESRTPLSLLYAGGGKLTIGCPMRYVAQALHLSIP